MDHARSFEVWTTNDSGLPRNTPARVKVMRLAALRVVSSDVTL